MSYGGQQAGGYGGQAATGGYGAQQTASYGGVTIVIQDSSSSSSSDNEGAEAQKRREEHLARQKALREQREKKVQLAAAERQKQMEERRKRQLERAARRAAKGKDVSSPFVQGAKVFLTANGGKNVRIMPDKSANALGGEGKLAEFTVTHVRDGKISLTNASGHTLRVFGGKPHGGGSPAGGLTWFKPSSKDGKQWHFKTAQGGYLGFLPNGEAKEHAKTGTGAHGTFTVKVKAPPNPWKLGASVFLKASSGKNLRIMPTGEVNGTGGTGALAQFKVSKVMGNRIQLTTAGGKTLRVAGGKPDGGGSGGNLCWFIPHKQAGDNVYCFETASGGFLGIKQDGTAKPHAQTGVGPHGQFTVQFA